MQYLLKGLFPSTFSRPIGQAPFRRDLSRVVADKVRRENLAPHMGPHRARMDGPADPCGPRLGDHAGHKAELFPLRIIDGRRSIRRNQKSSPRIPKGDGTAGRPAVGEMAKTVSVFLGSHAGGAPWAITGSDAHRAVPIPHPLHPCAWIKEETETAPRGNQG